jgi:hypothetical protein
MDVAKGAPRLVWLLTRRRCKGVPTPLTFRRDGPNDMATSDREAAESAVERLDFTLDIYQRAVAALMMFLGLRQWAVILGLGDGSGGAFETMTLQWQVATAHLAVVDLVASVGLWQRTAWGNVVWIYAAVAEVAMHTALIATFGADYLIVFVHLVSIIGFFVLLLLRRRATPAAS